MNRIHHAKRIFALYFILSFFLVAQRALPTVTDINQDGLDDNSSSLHSTTASSPMLLNQQTGTFSIGMIATGDYQHPRDRLVSIGYSVTMIPPTSGLSTFQQYDIVYLPQGWAQVSNGSYEILEARANDYRSYVYQGGSLFSDQPNPYQQPDDTITPSLLPYPITFYNQYAFDDYQVVVDPDHFITSGLAASEMPFPADQMVDIDPFYHTLVVGGTTGSASLVVGEYGAGRILVQTAHPARTAMNPFSNTVYMRMIEWVGTPGESVRKPVIFLPGGTGSRIYAPQSFDWSQPDGHGGTYTHTYNADEEIWINPVQIGLPGPDDYFDVLRLEKDGVTQSPAAHYGVNLEAREILGEAWVVDVYKNLLDDLQNAGYRPGVDLFVFPNDWRMDITANATLLDSKVQEALEKANGTTDTSQWTIQQVDLLTHSMGASVARQYISDPAHAARVNRLIAIGPAFLGAPKFTKLILFGDPLICYGSICPLNAAEVKDIAQNMPGLFGVAPGHAYWTFYDGSGDNLQVFQEDWDFDGDGQALGALSYAQFKSMLFRLDRDPHLDWDGAGKDVNQTVFEMGEAFHNRLDFSWDSGIPVPAVDIIAGTGLCTIGQIQAGYKISFQPPIGGPVQIGPIVRLKYVNGDNTVPLFSATLHDPARGIDHRGGANVYYVDRKFTDHAFLPSKDLVRQLVLNLLAGETATPEGIISQADVPKKCNGTILNIESPVELHVTDAGGNHTGWTTLPETGKPVIEQAIPGSAYNEVEETKSVYLPDDGAYTVDLKATGSGSFNLILDVYKSDGTVTSIVYLRAPLTTTTTGKMTYDTSSAEPPLLYLDHDGDGIFDETIAATSVLSLMESADTQPPQIQITSPTQGQVLAGGGLMAWQASDDSSGVLNEWGYIDMDTPNAVQVTNGAVMTLPPGPHTLTVLAEDRLGNASQEQISFTVYPFEWLSLISGSGTYSAQAGSTLPIKFSVRDLRGVFIPDESVELRLLDVSGNVVAGPFAFAGNPTQGVAILGSTQYHYNLQTKGLAPGMYIAQVTFNSQQMSGVVELPIVLR
jgi:pimeloyl-ACP methyl ester carboxylesterase